MLLVFKCVLIFSAFAKPPEKTQRQPLGHLILRIFHSGTPMSSA